MSAIDVIVANSVRTLVTVIERAVVDVRCGRCGNEFTTAADGRTAKCQRTCRLDKAPQAGPDVIPIRRGKPRRWGISATTAQDSA